MATYYKCLYCSPPAWQPASKVTQHMMRHHGNGDDFGTLKCPESYEELVRKWSSYGILEEKEV